MKKEMKKKLLQKTLNLMVPIYFIFGMFVVGIIVGGFVLTDIEMDREYQGFYYLATTAGSPEIVSSYLDEYLISVKDIHGYSALIWKNPSTDMDQQKEIIKSFKMRADDLSEQKKFENQRIDVQLSFMKLNDDMQGKQLQMVWWYTIHHRNWLLYSLIFMSCAWWWTLIVLVFICDNLRWR